MALKPDAVLKSKLNNNVIRTKANTSAVKYSDRSCCPVNHSIKSTTQNAALSNIKYLLPGVLWEADNSIIKTEHRMITDIPAATRGVENEIKVK